MIMIPAFMQQQLLEQGGVGPEPLDSPAPSSLAASTLVLPGVKSSHMTAQSAEQSADMTADAIAMKRGNKNKRKRWDSKKIQKKPARMKGRRPWGRPAAVIASRGMPASDREELNTFLQKHSLHAAAIQIDLPTKVPRWGSAELFEGDCILFSALVCSTCEPSWSSLTHPLSDTFLNTTPTSKTMLRETHQLLDVFLNVFQHVSNALESR